MERVKTGLEGLVIDPGVAESDTRTGPDSSAMALR